MPAPTRNREPRTPFEEKYLAEARRICLETVPDPRYEIFLFGSRARGHCEHGSDVDIGIAHHLEQITADTRVTGAATRVVPARTDVRDDDVAPHAGRDVGAVALQHAERAGTDRTETTDTHPYRIQGSSPGSHVRRAIFI
jgi:predicted nucleotidyltransferase